jgi:glycosyltransferase involved in cell wall biosynthesis
MQPIPVISVILPVYNASKYIAEAISSILNQTFTDFELIVINDGSTDDSLEIIKKFTDSRIILINKQNSGFLEAVLSGINICKGEFIVRMDADDISLNNRFEKQIHFLRKATDISLISGSVVYIDKDGIELSRSFSFTSFYAIKKYLNNYGCVIVHPTVMMRRKDYDAVGGYSKGSGDRFCDYHLWVKFIRYGFKIKNSSSIFLKYRISDSSLSSQFLLNEKAKNLLKCLLKEDEPNSILLNQLNQACQKQIDGVNFRIDKLNNLENRIFKNVSIIGLNKASILISQLKNFYAFFK